MLRSLLFTCFVSLFLLTGERMFGQVYYPGVPDFMDLNASYVITTMGTTSNPAWSPVLGTSDRYALITEQGSDPFTGGQLRFLPDGESKVIRLGNSQVSGGNFAEAEALTYHFIVDEEKPVLLLKFAVVFELPAHITENQPRFVLQVLDENGTLLDACTEYDVYSREGLSGFNKHDMAGVPILWRDWSNVGLNLKAYAGQKVRVRITTYDCAQGAHFGYSYFTATCISEKLTMEGCSGDRFTLKAPAGFASYQWNDGYTGSSREEIVGDSDLSLSCDITSSTGCTFTMSAYISASGKTPSQDTVMWDTICAGEAYYNEYFNLLPRYDVGTFPHEMTLFNPVTCQEGVNLTLYLTVIRRYHDIEAMICLGETYNAHGFTITPATDGIFRDSLHYVTATGCDSIVALKLVVSSTFTDVSGITTSLTACSGSLVHFTVPETDENIQYTWSTDGWNATARLSYRLLEGQGTTDASILFTDYAGYYGKNAWVVCERKNGCGSQTLTAYPQPGLSHSILYRGEVCEGEEIGGAGWDIPGDYPPGTYWIPQRFTSSQGCDSIRILHLTVFENPKMSIIASDSVVCSGDQLTLQADFQDPASITDFFWSLSGPQLTTMTVNPTATDTYGLYALINYPIPNSNPTPPYTPQILQCYSQVMQQVFVPKGVPDTIAATICDNECYTQNGFDEDTTGEYTNTIPGNNGCDLDLTLNLTVRDTNRVELFATITEGDYFTNWYSTLQYEGTYTQVRTNQYGCDSIVSLDLEVIPRETNLYDQVCRGESYTNNGFNTLPVQNDTSYSRLLMNRIGGDSLVIVHVTVNDSVVQQEPVTICQSELPYTWRGHTFPVGTDSRTIRYTGTVAATGCDSIVYLHLTVNDSIVQNVPLTICQNELPYTWRGHTFPAGTVSGTTRYAGSCAATGCDSIVYLALTVNDSIVQHEAFTICQGELPYTWRGNIIPTGTKSKTIRYAGTVTATGCDSIVYLHLTVNDSIVQNVPLTICQSDLPYTWRGNTIPTGTKSKTIRYAGSCALTGCDSIVYLALTVIDSIVQNVPLTLCQNELPYTWRGNTIPTGTNSKTIRYAGSTLAGCDSIVYLHLTVIPRITQYVSLTLCQSELPYMWRGHTFPTGTVSGTTRYAGTTSATGCDSIVFLNLTVSDSVVQHEALTLCQGELPYTWRGNTIPTGTRSGIIRYAGNCAATGCDSIVYLTLTVNDSIVQHETLALCQGELPYTWRGHTFPEGTVSGTTRYAGTTSATGCDSIVYLDLTVNPVYDTLFSGFICEGEEYTEHGFAASHAGVHTLHLQTAGGCDSTVTLHLAEEKKITGNIVIRQEDCASHAYSFYLDIIDSTGVAATDYIWDMGNGDSFHDEEGMYAYADSGAYGIQLRITSANGCESAFTHHLNVPLYVPEVGIEVDRLLVDEEMPTAHFRTNLYPGMSYRWDFGDGTTGEGASVSHDFHIANSVRYYDVTLRVSNADSCIAESTVEIEAAASPNPPNTFSPNADGINDIFMGNYRVEIVSRSGQRVFEGNDGWDGTYNGKQATEDTYFFRLYYRTAYGERMKTGYITLFR